MSDLLLSFYGDDFTGSTDALEFLTRAGARTVLFIDPPNAEQLAQFDGLKAVGVAGHTRSLPPAEMKQVLRPGLAALGQLGAPHIHYKVCSTFDSSPTIGNIGRVIEIGAEVFPAPFVPLVVGAPALGRYCVFGNLFARIGIGTTGEPLRLDRLPTMTNHPVTPMNESDLRLHLAEQTDKSIGLLSILRLIGPLVDARAALAEIVSDGTDAVLFDVLDFGQLPKIGTLLDERASREQPLFSVGSSGVEMALGAHWEATGKLTPRDTWEPVAPAEPLLVASGSCSPVTAGQIAHARENGFADVAIDTMELATETAGDYEIARAANATIEHFRAGRSVVVHNCTGPDDPRVDATNAILASRGMDAIQRRVMSAQLLGSALGKVIRRTIERVPVSRLCVAGGDTSSYVARELGIEAVEMIAPVAPGAPLCRAYAPGSPADGMQVNFKGGQVGSVEYFCDLQYGENRS